MGAHGRQQPKPRSPRAPPEPLNLMLAPWAVHGYRVAVPQLGNCLLSPAPVALAHTQLLEEHTSAYVVVLLCHY